MSELKRQLCWVCGADISGLLSVPSRGEEIVERSTCYEPEECIGRLQDVRDAWKALAEGRAKRRGVVAAKERLRRLGEM